MQKQRWGTWLKDTSLQGHLLNFNNSFIVIIFTGLNADSYSRIYLLPVSLRGTFLSVQWK